MKIIHISYGGPDRKIRDASGKEWKFEMHPRFGPAALDHQGEHADSQPAPRSPFWSAVTLWTQQGGVIGPDGFCIWKPEPAFELAHLGGRNYAIAGSALAEKYRRFTP
ncbi:hypothetical protein GmRootA79_53790 (plasmid) [Acidovorax sp. A79]|uniref:hypothetical protein n=1 Tax=Acidovorax sp. A79 TaxID=3056107 RepID=UPI0034E88F41